MGASDGQDGDADADADADADSSSDAEADGPDEASGDDGSVIIVGGGSGALCGANGRNDCGAYALCNPALGCVECLASTDCSAAESVCSGGDCVADTGGECGDDHPCDSGICSPLTKRCGACAANTDCAGATPRCRILIGKCVACISNDDCGHSAPICDPITYSCRVGCSSDAQCPGQTCDMQSALCVDIPTTDAGDAGGT